MWVYLFALLMAVSFHFFVEHLSRNQDFLKLSLAEQQKKKKKMLWSVYGGLAFGCLLVWLMENGLTAWAHYLPIIVYMLIFVGGIYLFWLAYILGIQRDQSKLTKSDGKLFRQPHELLNKFALTNLIAGIALLIVGIAIPLLKIQFQSWGELIILILVCRKFLLVQFEKADETSGS